MRGLVDDSHPAFAEFPCELVLAQTRRRAHLLAKTVDHRGRDRRHSNERPAHGAEPEGLDRLTLRVEQQAADHSCRDAERSDNHGTAD